MVRVPYTYGMKLPEYILQAVMGMQLIASRPPRVVQFHESPNYYSMDSPHSMSGASQVTVVLPLEQIFRGIENDILQT